MSISLIVIGDTRLLMNEFILTLTCFKNDQQTQTEITHTLQVKNTGAQYSSPSDSNDSSSSELDSDIEGTENITVTRREIHRRSGLIRGFIYKSYAST